MGSSWGRWTPWCRASNPTALYTDMQLQSIIWLAAGMHFTRICCIAGRSHSTGARVLVVGHLWSDTALHSFSLSNIYYLFALISPPYLHSPAPATSHDFLALQRTLLLGTPGSPTLRHGFLAYPSFPPRTCAR